MGSLFPLHKATKPWEQPFIQLVIIRVHNSVTATQTNGMPRLTPSAAYLFSFAEMQNFFFVGFLSPFYPGLEFPASPWTVDLTVALSAVVLN